MTTETTESTKAVKTAFEERFWHHGGIYKVTFMDGKTLTGLLVGVDRYNVVLRANTEGGDTADVFCFKHAMVRAVCVNQKGKSERVNP